MKEINFYKSFQPSKLLVKLCETLLAQGKTLYLLCTNPEEEKQLDYEIWAVSQNSFIPHGTLADPYRDQQPLLLGTDPHYASRADILLMTDWEAWNVSIQNTLLEKFDKILVLKEPKEPCRIKSFIIEQDKEGKWIKNPLDFSENH
jgi:DNA polymerase IIIc chi subunit